MINYKTHTETHNEGGYGYNPHEAAMRAEAAAAANARIESLIPRFEELRSTWNAAVAKYTVAGKLPMSALAKIEAEVGVTRAEMIMLKSRLTK